MECKRCNVDIPNDLEPTDYCNPCAQTIVKDISKEIQKVYALEPGKIYCLQIDTSRTDLMYLDAVITGFKELDITIVCIDQCMNFVPIPEGYEDDEDEKLIAETNCKPHSPQIVEGDEREGKII